MVTSGVLAHTHVITPSHGNSQNVLYDKPWTRVGPYAIGIMAAFALLEHGDAIKKMSKWMGYSLVLMGVTFTVFFMYVTAGYDYTTRDGGWSHGAILAFTVLARPLWAIGVMCFVFASYAGHGSIVGWLLSQPFWEPFGRLTFAAYLFHPAMIRVVYYTRTELFSINFYELCTDFLGFLTFSYCVAALLFVTVEMPAANLTNALVRKR